MRIPFKVAISDPNLLKDEFDQLSIPQQVTLKAFYGLELSKDIVNPKTGFNELDYWGMLQGNATQDELGYPLQIAQTPYYAKEYNQLWAVVGRRGGKTATIQSFIIAYEALLGGHEDYVKPGQECVIYLVAQKLEVAELNMPFISGIIKSSKLFENEIDTEIQGKIKLKNGVSIMPSPPSIKAQRGLACPVVAMDEVAFWYKDTDSANPDYEVERAIAKAQLQFPNYKRIGISTPWTKEGLLWKYYKAGTEGVKLGLSVDNPRNSYKGKLVCFSTTAGFENPALIKAGGRDRLLEELNEDPESFNRECLCVFPDSVSGYLSRNLVEKAFEKAKGIAERGPIFDDKDALVIPTYIAAIDPAFRSDNFGFCILHKDVDSIKVDVLRQWTPMKGQKLNPRTILAEIKPILDIYQIGLIYSDQGQLESLQELALDLGFSIEGVDFTVKSKTKIFNSLQMMINQGKMEVLDRDLLPVAETTFQELVTLERHQDPGRNIKISAPKGKHDDMAATLALATYKSVFMNPTLKMPEENIYRPPSPFEMCMATLERQQLELVGGY